MSVAPHTAARRAGDLGRLPGGGLCEPGADWLPRGAPGPFEGAALLPPEALDALMPMHVLLDARGRIGRHGPLLARLGTDLAGRDAFDAFLFRRPRGLSSMEALRGACGAPLRLASRADPRAQLAGVAVRLPDGGVLLNLSFGLGVVEAVRRHRLTATDFAPDRHGR